MKKLATITAVALLASMTVSYADALDGRPDGAPPIYNTAPTTYMAQPLACSRPDVVARLNKRFDYEMTHNLLLMPYQANGGMIQVTRFRTTAPDYPPNGVSCTGTAVVTSKGVVLGTFETPYIVQMTDDGTDFVITSDWYGNGFQE